MYTPKTTNTNTYLPYRCENICRLSWDVFETMFIPTIPVCRQYMTHLIHDIRLSLILKIFFCFFQGFFHKDMSVIASITSCASMDMKDG